MNYKSLLKPYLTQMDIALRKFVSINSVYDETTITKEMPFGKGVDEALKFIGSLGEQYGFKVDYCDGYCTELTIGDGDRLIGIYGHADVVPISGNWSNPPFDCILKDGNYYGRGTSDDKGPVIAAFYALKALKDNGMLDGYKVKFVVGGDEERGSSCLDHYFEKLHKPYPDYGFTPDSDFPLIYGEKGIINFYPELKVNAPQIKSIKGGVATNAVCDRVEVVLNESINEFKEYLIINKVNCESAGDVVTFLGKSAHGSTPEAGVNAALIALKHLGEFFNIEEFKTIAEKLEDPSGKLFNGFASTKLLGGTTYCLGIIDYENGLLKFTINFRHPEGVDPLLYNDNFNKEFGTTSTVSEPSPELLYDPECKLVQTLLNAYRKETHDMSAPLTTGGGTYAKHSKNTIAFGALFPGRVSTMHEPNELMPKEDFELAAVIYARAIYDLGHIE